MITLPVDLARNGSKYLINLNCEWIIRMPLHQKLHLTFVKGYSIERSKECSSDFLAVRYVHIHFEFFLLRVFIYYYVINYNLDTIYMLCT